MKTRIKSLLLAISIFISILLVVYAINSNNIKLFTTQIAIKTSSSCFIEKGEPSLIVDKNGRRLLFTNKDFKVAHIENCDREYPIDKVTDVACDGRNFYALGVRNISGTMDVDRVKVLRYDIDGRNPTVIYDAKKNPDEKKISSYKTMSELDFLADMDAMDGAVYITEFHNFTITEAGNPDYRVKVTKVNGATGDTAIIIDTYVPNMFYADYCVQDGKVYITNYAGQIAKADNDSVSYIETPEKSVVGGFRLIDSKRFAWVDEFSEKTYINDTVVGNNDGIMKFGKSGSGIVWVTKDDVLHFMPDTESPVRVIDKVELTIPFVALVAVETAACLWLVFVIVFFAIRKTMALYRDKRYVTLAKAGLVAMAILCSLLISSYYTYKIISKEKHDKEKELHQLCTFFAMTTEPAEFETTSFRRINDENPSFAKKFDTYTKLKQDDDEYVNVFLFRKADGVFVHIYDSRNLWQYGNAINYDELASQAETQPNHVGMVHEWGYSYNYDIQPVVNENGEVAGAVCIYKESENIQRKAVKKSIEIAISLFIIFIIIYILALETGFFIRCRNEMKKRRQNGVPYPELAMVHSHGFLIDLLTAFDRVILVLITRRILMASPLGQWSKVALLMTIPLIMRTASSIIGAGLFWLMPKKGTTRKFLATSLFIMFLGNCGIILAFAFAKEAAFPLFCLLKLIGGTANECASCALGTVYGKTANGTELYKIWADNREGHNASNIFGTLMGGFILNTFGHTAVYIVNSIVFVPIAILMILTLPKNLPFSNEGDSETKMDAKALVRFFSRPAIFLYFTLLFLPMMAISSYSGFFFPLYTAAFAMPEIYITALTVFAQVVGLSTSNTISNAAEKHDHWLIMVAALGFTGILFLGFKLNPGIIWATAVLFMITAMSSQCNNSREVLWKREAIKYGTKPGLLVIPMSIVGKFVSLLKEPLLSLFMLFGNDRACEMFGAFCVICTILFLATTARSALRVIPKTSTEV